MIDFLSITPQLQQCIVEKIAYFDQIEFERASISGKQIVGLHNQQSAADIGAVDILETEVFVFIKNGKKIEGKTGEWKSLTKLREKSQLPRFKVSEVRINKYSSIETITDFNDVIDHTCKKLRLSLISGPVDEAVLKKVSEVFNVTHVYLHWHHFPKALTVFQIFPKMDFVHLSMYIRPKKEYLLNIRCSKIELVYNRQVRGMVSSTNVFFEEWFNKSRILNWFKVSCEKVLDSFTEKMLFADLPYSILWKFDKRRHEEIVLKRMEEYEEPYGLYDADVIYSIDRGDKRLMVFVSDMYSFVLAQEYIDLEDVMEIRKIKD